MNLNSDNYKWFYNNNRSYDKIGISPDEKYIMHDNVLFTLTKFKNININNNLYLVYKLNQSNNIILYDSILHKQHTELYFKFKKNKKKSVFNCIIFNGKSYK